MACSVVSRSARQTAAPDFLHRSRSNIVSDMARPKNADGRRTRQAIFDAALHLFSEKGYFGTSVREIASVVGVRESAIYNYFPSKEALFAELIAAGPPSKVPAFAQLVSERVTDVRATLIKIATLSLENYATVREQKLFNIWLSDGLRLAKAGWRSIGDSSAHGRRSLHSLMRRLMRDGWLRRGDPRLLEMEFMGPLIIWRLYRAGGVDVPEVRNPRAFAREHVDRFLRGAASESTLVHLAADDVRPRRTKRPSRRVDPTNADLDASSTVVPISARRRRGV